jgi:predicted amidohydrolase YtcJ
MTADLLLVNGRIWTGAGADVPGEVEALAVRDGLVLAAGSRADLEPLAGPATTVLDVDGRRVVPGLVDAHIHAIWGGLTWDQELRWGGIAKLGEALGTIRERAPARAPPAVAHRGADPVHPRGRVVLVRGAAARHPRTRPDRRPGGPQRRLPATRTPSRRSPPS